MKKYYNINVCDILEGSDFMKTNSYEFPIAEITVLESANSLMTPSQEVPDRIPVEDNGDF